MEDSFTYPKIIERVKALVIDSFCVVGFIILFSIIYSSIGGVSVLLKQITFVFIFLLYDPIFTAFTGGTIGHKAIGIEVKQLGDSSKNINIILAIIRFIIKTILGLVSLVTINNDLKNRAIHDLVANSVVLYKIK